MTSVVPQGSSNPVLQDDCEATGHVPTQKLPQKLTFLIQKDCLDGDQYQILTTHVWQMTARY